MGIHEMDEIAFLISLWGKSRVMQQSLEHDRWSKIPVARRDE